MQSAAGKHHHEDNWCTLDQTFGNGQKQRLRIDMMLFNTMVASGTEKEMPLRTSVAYCPAGMIRCRSRPEPAYRKKNVRILQTEALLGPRVMAMQSWDVFPPSEAADHTASLVKIAQLLAMI